MQNTHKTSRHPLACWAFFCLGIYGTAQTLTGAKPGTIAAQLDPVMQTVWSSMLGLGCLVALIGILWRSDKLGLEMESIGLLASACATIIYAFAVYTTVGMTAGFMAILMSGTFAAGCLLRRRQVETVLKKNGKRRVRRGSARHRR